MNELSHFEESLLKAFDEEIALFDKLYEEATNAGNKDNSEKPSTDD